MWGGIMTWASQYSHILRNYDPDSFGQGSMVLLYPLEWILVVLWYYAWALWYPIRMDLKNMLRVVSLVSHLGWISLCVSSLWHLMGLDLIYYVRIELSRGLMWCRSHCNTRVELSVVLALGWISIGAYRWSFPVYKLWDISPTLYQCSIRIRNMSPRVSLAVV